MVPHDEPQLRPEPHPLRLVQLRLRLRVLVRGDKLAKFGAAMTVFDEVRRAGIQQVSIETVVSTTAK